MFLQNFLSVQKKQYIKHRAFNNLCVVPYIRGRLVFAEIAARLLEEDHFDLILVDLPYFMNGSSFLDIPIGLFPTVSSLIVNTNDSYLIPFHFSPNDAACASVALVRLLKMTGRPFDLKCIDDSNIIHYPEGCFNFTDVELKDDYFVFIDGIEAYYASAFQQLDQAWDDLSEERQFFLIYRAGVIAERLRDHVSKGMNVLFFCEYRLWWLISKILDRKIEHSNSQFFSQWKDMKAVLVIGDPYRFWSYKLLDDYPAVVLRFYESFQLGVLKGFDKLKSVNEVIVELISKDRLKRENRLSIRRLMAFQNFLRKRLVSSLRITPLLISHLNTAAHSCVSKRFAKEISNCLLKYPYSDTEDILRYFDIQKDTMEELKRGFDMPDMAKLFSELDVTSGQSHDHFQKDNESSQKRMEFVQKIVPYLSKKEMRELHSQKGIVWAVEKDYLIHEIVCHDVRKNAERKLYSEIIRKSTGDSGDGIHWKATIASWAAGEKEIYVRESLYLRKSNFKLDEYTPVVFLLSEDLKDAYKTIHDSNTTQRNIELGNRDFNFEHNPPPDCVYSIFYTSAKEEYFRDDHIIKAYVSSITFLYTRHVMGTERYKNITLRPEKFQCRTPPCIDPDLKRFYYSELSIAWAIKYADKAVLIAARTGWKPSSVLEKFARTRNVRILHVPLSSLRPEILERLQIIHFISTPLKNHPARDIILRRFIE